jgi:hypothetical protein
VEAEILKTVGQIAGIGGLALGVLLIVFRDIVRKKYFLHCLQPRHTGYYG